MSEQPRWHQTGERQDIPMNVSRIPEFDWRQRNHLWTWALLFRMEPGAEVPRMDHENLLLICPAACFYCEQVYVPAIQRGFCPGPAVTGPPG